MSAVPPKPQAPSSEHKWALIQVSKRQAWVGLTEREFVMLYELTVNNSPNDWIMWFAGWTEWRPVSKVEKFWSYVIPAADTDLPRPNLPLLAGASE